MNASVKRILTATLSASLVPLTALAADDEYDAAFVILRKGEQIGFHVVDVTRTPEGFVAESRVEMKVKFGPLPLYRYRHISHEEWRDGQLVAIETTTNDNGERDWLKGRRENGVLMIEGSDFEGPAPADATPASYWNKAVVHTQKLLNTQNGEIIEVDVSSPGLTPTPDDAIAEEIRMVGTVGVRLWYAGNRWVGSNFVVDGEELTYQLVKPEERTRLYARLD